MIRTPLGTELSSSEAIFAFDGDKAYSYSDLYQLASSYSKLLSPYTVSFIIGSNTFETVAFYLACLSNNSPVLLLPQNVSQDIFDQLLKTFTPSQVFDTRSSIEPLHQYSLLDEFLYVSDVTYSLDPNQQIPALLLPTSGSTGARKLVKVSHDNLISNTKSIIEYLSIDSTSLHICSLPFSYTYGLSCINTHVSASASIVLNDFSIIDNKFWQLVEHYSPTTFSGVPYTYQVLSRFKRDFIASLPFKKYTQAGGKLSSDLVQHFHSIISSNGGEFIVMYGQTEATARMSYLPSSCLPEKSGSIGIPIPGGRFSIEYIDDLMPVNGYSTGELLYYGPNVTHGYCTSLNNIYLFSHATNLLRTGDIAYQDRDGYFFITGRLSRFAKINGIRVSLDDIEYNIDNSDVACVSDDIFIYVFHTSSVCQDELSHQLKSFTSLPSRVFRFILIDTIPRNDSGKVIYGQLTSRVSN